MKLSTMARRWAAECEIYPDAPLWIQPMFMQRFPVPAEEEIYEFANRLGPFAWGPNNSKGGEASMLLCLLACLLEDEGK